jgi:hypothetical protein
VVGILLAAQLEQRRIDLHRVDVPGALPQRDRDVGPGAGPDDEHVVQRVAVGQPLVRGDVLRLLPLAIRGPGDPLVRDAVDADH